MAKATASATPQYPFLQPDDPVCLIIKATLKPIGDTDRFQPAGFPEVGHVIYDAPRTDGNGRPFKEKVCIVDSPASMANHLETVCLRGTGDTELHDDLAGLPFLVCKTVQARIENSAVVVESDEPDVVVTTTFLEAHRMASDYFVSSKDKPTIIGGERDGQCFRDVLTNEFGIVAIPKKKGATFFIAPSHWWRIYRTIFKYDPNSLVHGVLFAKEQIKISRLLTAHLEAFGTSRVGRSGVKLDPLGKSLQPIFSVDDETARQIQATFIIDLALLRSYGRGQNGLNDNQKTLLLDLALWKVRQLLARPFRYRTQCFLGCQTIRIETENGLVEAVETKEGDTALPALLTATDIAASIRAVEFESNQPWCVLYPADKFYVAAQDDGEPADANDDELGAEVDEEEAQQ